ncbi:hypothetical protein QV65_33360 [Rhodococcus erythropolis]|nr:hypothetical protein QV65_33360 [Rhodococcus erythropolis]
MCEHLVSLTFTEDSSCARTTFEHPSTVPLIRTKTAISVPNSSPPAHLALSERCYFTPDFVASATRNCLSATGRPAHWAAEPRRGTASYGHGASIR